MSPRSLLANTYRVDLKNRDASGDLVTARYSKHKNVHIGCGMRKLQNGAGGVFTFGFCQAEDAAIERILCNTQDTALLEAIASSADYGFITFSWDTNNVCTRIGFTNQSIYLPRGLDDNI